MMNNQLNSGRSGSSMQGRGSGRGRGRSGRSNMNSGPNQIDRAKMQNAFNVWYKIDL